MSVSSTAARVNTALLPTDGVTDMAVFTPRPNAMPSLLLSGLAASGDLTYVSDIDNAAYITDHNANENVQL